MPPNPATSGSTALRITKYAFYAAIIVFFAWYLYGFDWAALADVHVGWPVAILALVPSVLFRYVGVGVWRTVLGLIGVDKFPPFVVLARVFARAWMGRYVPGKVAWIAGKVVLAAAYGISKSKLAISSIVEASAQLTGLGLMSLTLLLIDGRILDTHPVLWYAAFIAAAALVTVLLPPVFNRLVALAYRIAKRGAPVQLSWRAISTAVGIYAVVAFLPGTANAILAYAVDPSLSASDFPFLVASFGLAVVAGMAMPFAPNGIGVRDSIQFALLTIVLAAPAALTVVLLSRVLATVADLVFLGATEGVYRVASRKTKAA